MFIGRGCVALLVVAGTAAQVAGQESFLWTGMEGNRLWNDEGNWSNLTTGGGIDGFPTVVDTASFGASASVAGGAARDVNVLDPMTVLTFGGAGGSSSSTTLAGIVANNGTIAFAPDSANNAFGRPDQRVLIEAMGVVELVGSGVWLLSGTETGFDGAGSGGADVSTLINRSGHTIMGTGILQELAFVNEGAFEVVGGGVRLEGVEASGASAYEIAADGTLELDGSTVDGGTLVAETGALLTNVGGVSTLSGTGIEGDLLFGGVAAVASSVTLSGVIANNGLLTLVADTSNNSFGRPDQQLAVAAADAAELVGTGSVVLSGSETGFNGVASSGDDLSTLRNGPMHTIMGSGIVQDLEVINEGAVDVFGGVLVLNRSVVRGPAAYMIAADGTLTVNSSTIEGGTLTASDGARLNTTGGEGVLRDVAIAGDLISGGVAGASSSTTLSGVIVNDAVITFEPDTSNNAFGRPDQQLFVDAGDTVDLVGSGVVVFSGDETGFDGVANTGENTSTLNIGAGQTVRGPGIIQDLAMTNEGSFEVAGGDMLFSRVLADGSAAFDIAADGVLKVNASEIDGAVIASVAGGRLNTTSGVSVLSNARFEGEVVYGRSSGSASSTTISGVITNNGVIAFEPDSMINAFGRPDQQLAVDAADTVTIGGVGMLVLSGSQTGLNGAADSGANVSTLINGVDHTIVGVGVVQDLALVNNGLMLAEGGTLEFVRVEATGEAGRLVVRSGATAEITAGVSLFAQGTVELEAADSMLVFDGGKLAVTEFLGDLTMDGGVFAPGAGGVAAAMVSGDYTQSRNSADLEIEIGGAAAGQFDTLAVQGDVSLLGELEVVLVDGFEIQGGEAFDVVFVDGSLSGTFRGAPEGGLVQTFDEVARPGTSNVFVSYVGGDGNDVRLTTAYCPADVNGDGVYNGADFNAWLTAFGDGDQNADQNRDGVLNGADFNAWLTNFGFGCG